MPQVPQTNREVRLNGATKPYMSAHLTGDMFGANIARATASNAEALKGIANAAMKIQETLDDAKVLELSNNIDQWEQDNLYNKDTGYYHKNGKDAVGKSDEIMQNYDKLIEQYKSENRLNPYCIRRIDDIAQRKKARIYTGVNNHDAQQTTAWAKTEGQNALNNTINSAINSRNNPDELKTHFATIGQIIRWSGGLQNLDEASIQMATKEATSDGHIAVINSYIGEGSLKAGEYLEQHKSEINPEKLPGLISAVKNNQLTYTARTTAQALLNLPLSDAYSNINSIQDPKTRDAVEGQFRHLKSQQEAIQKENDIRISNEIMQEVYSLYENGGNISEIMTRVNKSDLSLEMKADIYKNLKEMQELENAGNNWADYNILLDMASEDNEMFKNINPATFNLTKEQYNKIVEMQRKSAEVQYTPEAKLKDIVNKFDTGFLPQGSDGLHSAEYKTDLIRFLSKIERLQGKAFDINHIDEGQLAAIIGGFSYKDPNATNKNIDEVKELYMRAKKHGEIYDMAARQYTAFKQDNKREPSPEEMFGIVKRCYNSIETEYKQRAYGKVNKIVGFNDAVNNTIPKKGETKVLTYFADTMVPQIGRELDVKLTSVNGSRYRAGDPGGHGKGRKLDISMSEHSVENKIRIYEKMLSHPLVASIGCSDPIILKRFAGNPKIRDLRQYDANYKKTHPGTTMNHVNHMDISFDTRFGGDAQGK